MGNRSTPRFKRDRRRKSRRLGRAIHRPAQIGHLRNVISQIGAVGTPRHGQRDWLRHAYQCASRRRLRIYQNAGLLDNDNFPGAPPSLPEIPPMLDANRRLRSTLVNMGYQVTYREFAGGHDWLAIGDTIGDALTALIGRVAR